MTRPAVAYARACAMAAANAHAGPGNPVVGAGGASGTCGDAPCDAPGVRAPENGCVPGVAAAEDRP